MILGYVDVQDRIYDLNFATLRLRVRIEPGPSASESRVAFSQVAGEGARAYRVIGEADVTAEAAMDHDGHRIPLLRAVEGHLYRHEAGLLFFANPGKRDPEDPGFFLVKLRAMPSAVRFFFEDQEGRELISIPNDEILIPRGRFARRGPACPTMSEDWVWPARRNPAGDACTCSSGSPSS